MKLIYFSGLLLLINFLSIYSSQTAHANDIECALTLASLKKKTLIKELLKKKFCPHCNQLFSTKYTLKRHLRSVQNQKQYPCPNACGKRFTRNYNAQNHAASRTCPKRRAMSAPAIVQQTAPRSRTKPRTILSTLQLLNQKKIL